MESRVQGVDNMCDQETPDIEERRNSFANGNGNKSSFSSVSSEKSQKVTDNYEPMQGKCQGRGKDILKHAEKSAHGLKNVFSYKSRKTKGDYPAAQRREILDEFDSSDDECLSIQSPRDEPILNVSQAAASYSNGSFNSKENVVQTCSSNLDNESPMKNSNLEEDTEKAF